MNFEEISTFLTILEYGNLSTAAEKLFITQGTASHRIQLLEQELGFSLLLRQKGHRQVELTPMGRSFIPVAEQWVQLWKSTMQMKETKGFVTIVIGSVDAVNNYTFLRLYQDHMEKHPEVRLSVNTFHSKEIHELLESRNLDIGYVFSELSYPYIISKPIYREKMYLLCRNDSPYHNNMSNAELAKEDEVYLRWGQDFELWQNRHWSMRVQPAITINTGNMQRHYLRGPKNWTIAPMSVIQVLLANSDEYAYYTLEDPPPPRICYQLTLRHTQPSKRDAIELFSKAVEKFVSTDSSICHFEKWMLEEQKH